MSYNSSNTLLNLTEPIPFSLDEWKTVLTEWTTKAASRFPSSFPSENSNNIPNKKKEKISLPRNRVFGENILESLLISPSNQSFQSSVGVSRTETTKGNVGTNKRFWPTYQNPNNIKPSQRTTYVNENFLILKLSKERQARQTINPIIDQSDTSDQNFSSTNKHSTISSLLSTPSNRSMRNNAAPTISSQTSFPFRLSPILRVQGQKRRVKDNEDTPLTPPGQNELTTNSNFIPNMSTALSTNPTSNRSRLSNETMNNNLLFSTEKYKSSNSNLLRQPRASLTTTTMPSIFLPTQSLQKSNQATSKSRLQQEKSTTSKEVFDYPDPFTNCTADVMNRLVQLSKLQNETVEWEKKKRFTKRKPTNQSNFNGKESP